MQPSIDAWNAIVKDTHARFAIDDGRVYAAGMSGAARLAIYLASRAGDYVVGSTLVVDGGVTHAR